MTTTMMMLSRGRTRRHGKRAGNQNRDCEKLHEFRHG
jgi:hypothetical protein